jgi:hypothetical protein
MNDCWIDPHCFGVVEYFYIVSFKARFLVFGFVFVFVKSEETKAVKIVENFRDGFGG